MRKVDNGIEMDRKSLRILIKFGKSTPIKNDIDANTIVAKRQHRLRTDANFDINHWVKRKFRCLVNNIGCNGVVVYAMSGIVRFVR